MKKHIRYYIQKYFDWALFNSKSKNIIIRLIKVITLVPNIIICVVLWAIWYVLTGEVIEV